MAYHNYYPNYSQPYYQPPMPDQLAQLRQQQYQNAMMQQAQQMQQPPVQQQPTSQNSASIPVNMQNNIGRIWVNGYNEASSYFVAPNTAVDLWDINEPIVYLKQADASGKPKTEIFDLVKRTEEKPMQTDASKILADYASKNEVEELKKEIDELKAELHKKRSPAKKTE